MRNYLAILWLSWTGVVTAQVNWGADAGAALLPIERVNLVGDWLGTNTLEPFLLPKQAVSRVPSPYLFLAETAQPAPFDFSATKPHLAFFCRLELDIEEATKFPVRFRLGEVRGWQQELTKRD
ncbi:hypothetical protein CLV84_2913 [Neolewinella xylanilytica]|uniref:Uncharacterized protein n=1 Tax=Neolewinella xylanilytica TaxID=1514080 RepID=A0A2S6I489_9BACT|nr:hypothetical protein [Neolewinella xylanilytica]PPK85996.1 hypothetical protein CLV84_2913 [Neolewinella xylanilytica]